MRVYPSEGKSGTSAEIAFHAGARSPGGVNGEVLMKFCIAVFVFAAAGTVLAQ